MNCIRILGILNVKPETGLKLAVIKTGSFRGVGLDFSSEEASDDLSDSEGAEENY